MRIWDTSLELKWINRNIQAEEKNDFGHCDFGREFTAVSATPRIGRLQGHVVDSVFSYRKTCSA